MLLLEGSHHCWSNTTESNKHKILEMPDLFQLSVAKFMYSFSNGGLPHHFDNYFAEIASLSPNIKQDLLLCKN